jgi:hypothetical protein
MEAKRRLVEITRKKWEHGLALTYVSGEVAKEVAEKWNRYNVLCTCLNSRHIQKPLLIAEALRAGWGGDS